MVQCNVCGKFIRSKEGVTCPKCKSRSHNECARVPVGVTVEDSWMCGECQTKMPKLTAGILELPTSPSCLAETQCQPQVDLVRILKEEIRSELGQMHSLKATELKAYKEEMLSFFQEMRVLKSELSAIRTCFNERMDAVEARLTALEQGRNTTPKPKEISSLETALSEVKFQLNSREQEYLLNDVIITGIPEQKGENQQHLTTILATKMGLSLEERDIVIADRVPPSQRPREDTLVRGRRIVVRFARRCTRDAYIRAARVRRGLTTHDIGLEDAPQRIYVNERLTKLNGQQLFAKVREELRTVVEVLLVKRRTRLYPERAWNAFLLH